MSIVEIALPEYRLSNLARSELSDIITAGIHKFGVTTSTSYLVGLLDLLNRLAQNPSIGRVVTKGGPSARRHPYRRHVVFYDATSYGVFIVRIIPMAMLQNRDELPD